MVQLVRDTTVTAGFTLAGTLIGKYAGAVPPVDFDWLIGLALGMILGVFVGVTVRANDALNFTDSRLTTKLERLGFTPDQVQAIMKRLSEQVVVTQIDTSLPKPSSFLQALETEVPAGPNPAAPGQAPRVREEKPFDWDAYWRQFDEVDPTKVVDNLKRTGPQAIREIIELNQRAKKPDSDIIARLHALTGVRP
jgi:hypothetical protein